MVLLGAPAALFIEYYKENQVKRMLVNWTYFPQCFSFNNHDSQHNCYISLEIADLYNKLMSKVYFTPGDLRYK